MKTKIKIIGVLLFAVLLLTCVTARVDYSGLGKAADVIPLNKKALTGTLPNGLRYYILENSFPENRAYAALVVNAGSVLERDDERGFAHFVEHLAFIDTERFPKNGIIEYFRSVGSRFGSNINAYTSYNETVYHFDVTVENVNGIKRIPDRALAVLDDWTYAVNFHPEDVASESRVVIEEIRARLGVGDRIRKIMLPILFKGSAFENRDIIGLADIIENATPEQLKSFYDRWYTSDNMALIFVGDFDGKALEAELARHFNKPAAARPVNRPVYDLPPPRNGNFHIEIVTDPELTSSSISIYYKQKQSGRNTRGTLGYYRESIINYLIDIMFNQRLEEAASDPQSASNESWGGVWRWSDNSGFYSMGTSPKSGNTEEALRELLLEKESMRRFGFTESELERAKMNLVSYLEKLLSEKDRTESRTFIRQFTSHFLYGEDMADIEWEVNAVNAMLPGIGLRDISRTINNYFSANDINVFLFAPQAEADNLPSAERIRAIFRETRNTRMTPRQDKSLSGELVGRIPTPGTIISEEIDTDTGAYILTLNNGAKVILKQTENRNNEIILHVMARGGTANATEETIVSAYLLSEMINVSGLGPYSRTDLVNKLAGKQVSMSFWTSDYNRGFQGSSTTQDINTLFEMIHLFFTDPRLDERAIAAMLDQYRTNLVHQNEDPQRFFSREITRIRNSNHPLFKPMELEDMNKVSLEQAFDFLNKCINPGDYTFVFTGNVNIDLMRELSSIYIASIPSATSMNRWTNPVITRPASGRTELYKGVDNRCMVYIGWFARGSDTFSEQQNQVAAVLSEYLDILLTDEIREKMGGVYSISAWSSVSVIPGGEYMLNVYFYSNPDRLEEIITAVKENILDIFRKPLDIDIFNKSVLALLTQYERSIQRNLFIAQSYTNSSVLFSTPLNRINSRPELIRAVTPQAVQTLCRDIVLNGPVEIVLYPEVR